MASGAAFGSWAVDRLTPVADIAFHTGQPEPRVLHLRRLPKRNHVVQLTVPSKSHRRHGGACGSLGARCLEPFFRGASGLGYRAAPFPGSIMGTAVKAGSPAL
jgi:hypothetical protein